uniref:acetate--CoA ligase n=1 Tax=Steinernema glaseri TaxID=37863 RepID=A0A1I7Z165_9BILA
MENVATLCLEKHLRSAKEGDPIVYKFHWEGNYWDGDIHDYAQLSLDTVSVVAKKCAHVLTERGVSKGDTVVAFVPTVVQLPIIALGCAHIGAVFAFINAAEEDASVLAQKIAAARPSVIICVDGFWRGTELISVKKNLDTALSLCPSEISPLAVLVIRHAAPHAGTPPPTEEFVGRRPCYRLAVPMAEGRDFHWAKLIVAAPDAVCDAAETLPDDVIAAFFISTPEGVRRRDMTAQELQEQIGSHLRRHPPRSLRWILGFPDVPQDAVVLLATMVAGAEIVLFEGTLSHPDPSRIGQVISKYEVQEIIISQADVQFLMKFPDYVHFWKTPSLQSVIYAGEADDSDEMKWLAENFAHATVKPP